MPELPEVEVTRRSFAERIAGAVIEGSRLGKPLRWPLGVSGDALVGRRVINVERRGKYLLLMLDHGVLLVHLGMSGSLLFSQVLPPPGPHDHFDLYTAKGGLRLHDPRRFGAVVYSPSLEDGPAVKLLAHLGVEPLGSGFDPVPFHHGLRQRRASIKQVLLAGDLVVGVGNIYASEALFLAGIRPTAPANRLSLTRATRLHGAVISVLQRALALGGSTLRDFSAADGQGGYFQMDANVYGRDGQDCRDCGASIRLLRQGQRSSYFCPVCQRR